MKEIKIEGYVSFIDKESLNRRTLRIIDTDPLVAYDKVNCRIYKESDMGGLVQFIPREIYQYMESAGTLGEFKEG